MNYHAHVFFDLPQEQQIRQLREQLCLALNPHIFIGDLLLKAVGPLPKPMFQMEFEEKFIEEIISKLRFYFASFTVLIHPLLEDEYVAHTEHAFWLGPCLALNLDRL